MSNSNGNLKDFDFVEGSNRPFVEGATNVNVPHMYDPSLPSLPTDIPSHFLQFSLRPSWCGSASSPIVYFNAQDPQLYHLKVTNPIMTIWLLIRNTTFCNGGYVKRRLVEESLRQRIQMFLINPSKIDFASVRTDPLGGQQLKYDGGWRSLPDAVIPRVGANVDYFGMAALRHFECLNVRVINHSVAIEASKDKLFTHQIVGAAGIPVPKSVLSKYPFDYHYIEGHFEYPIIVKLTSGSKGEAVWKVDSRKDLEGLIDQLDQTKPIIFQQFLHHSNGRDIRCFVVGDRVVAAMMRVAAKGFKANVHQGGHVVPVEVDSNLNDIAVSAAKLCGLDVTGVDVLMDSSTYMICEVNSSPGFQGLERAQTVNVAKEYLNYVRDLVVRGRERESDEKKSELYTHNEIPIPKELSTEM